MKLVLRPEFRVQLLSLDPSEGRIVAKALNRLQDSPSPIGKPLRGSLVNARSIRTGHNSRLRIVYQPIGEIADLVAVGPREESFVYIIALEIIGS